MRYNIVQINTNHCWGAYDILQQFIKEEEIDFAMVTEPIHIPEKNWVNSKNKNSAIHWTPKVTERVKELFKDEFIAIEVKDIVLISCYISPRVNLREFSKILRKLEANIGLLDKRKQIAICGDFNAHSLAWGSGYTSCKGDRLSKWMETNNLIVINEGNAPTCVRPQGTSIVDLTWATATMAKKIKEWKVEVGKLSLSDHNYITFGIDLEEKNKDKMNTYTAKKKSMNNRSEKSPRWKMETLDQEIYDEVLKWKCSMHNNNGSLEEGGEDNDVEWIRQAMIEAADASMRRARKMTTNKKQVYWWNDNIAEIRNNCIADRRKWTRAKTRERKRTKTKRRSRHRRPEKVRNKIQK